MEDPEVDGFIHHNPQIGQEDDLFYNALSIDQFMEGFFRGRDSSTNEAQFFCLMRMGILDGREGYNMPMTVWAKQCRILSPEHPEVLLDVEGPSAVDYEVCIMNRALGVDILWMSHYLIRTKTNKGISLLSQTYLYPLSLPQPLLQVALAVHSHNHSDMAQRPTSTRRLRGTLHQHLPHKSPFIHQPSS